MRVQNSDLNEILFDLLNLAAAVDINGYTLKLNIIYSNVAAKQALESGKVIETPVLILSFQVSWCLLQSTPRDSILQTTRLTPVSQEPMYTNVMRRFN